MWHSEEDMMADLALLNDFGSPEDKEPYKILSSVGRGIKKSEKPKPSNVLIDSRTGEPIDDILDDEDLSDKYCRSKGRGSPLGRLIKSRCQLQEQLRLAKPLGSGDEIIEAYYNRHRPQQKSTVNESASSFESCSQDDKVELSETKDAVSSTYSKNTVQRIKAVRSSGMQSNALLSSLFSKNATGLALLNADREKGTTSTADMKSAFEMSVCDISSKMKKDANFNEVLKGKSVGTVTEALESFHINPFMTQKEENSGSVAKNPSFRTVNYSPSNFANNPWNPSSLRTLRDHKDSDLKNNAKWSLDYGQTSEALLGTEQRFDQKETSQIPQEHLKSDSRFSNIGKGKFYADVSCQDQSSGRKYGRERHLSHNPYTTYDVEFKPEDFPPLRRH